MIQCGMDNWVLDSCRGFYRAVANRASGASGRRNITWQPDRTPFPGDLGMVIFHVSSTTPPLGHIWSCLTWLTGPYEILPDPIICDQKKVLVRLPSGQCIGTATQWAPWSGTIQTPMGSRTRTFSYPDMCKLRTPKQRLSFETYRCSRPIKHHSPSTYHQTYTTAAHKQHIFRSKNTPPFFGHGRKYLNRATRLQFEAILMTPTAESLK